MSNFFVFVRVYTSCDSAKWCSSFVKLSSSIHIRVNVQWRQYLCSVCILAYCTRGKWSYFWENNCIKPWTILSTWSRRLEKNLPRSLLPWIVFWFCVYFLSLLSYQN